MDFLVVLLSGAAAAAFIEGVIGIAKLRIDIKARREDAKKAEKEEWQKRMEENNAVQNEALKFILYDRIKYLAQTYIAAGEVDFDDRRILNAMHKVYHGGLDGNGDLDDLMNAVGELPLKKKG